MAPSWCRQARSVRHVGSALNELPAKFRFLRSCLQSDLLIAEASNSRLRSPPCCRWRSFVRLTEDRAAPVASVRPPAGRWSEDRFVLGVRPLARLPAGRSDDRAALGRLDVGPVSSLWRSAAAAGPSLLRPLHPQPTPELPRAGIHAAAAGSFFLSLSCLRSRPFSQGVVTAIIDCRAGCFVCRGRGTRVEQLSVAPPGLGRRSAVVGVRSFD